MTCEAALVKLGFLLGRFPESPEKVRQLMQENLRGELTAAAAQGHHAQADGEGGDGDSVTSKNGPGMGFESAGFLDTVFNALKDSKSTAVAESAQEAVASVSKELDTMDAIQQALLPTLMCAAAAQGFTEDLSRMIFAPSGGTMNTSAECARIGDYDRRTPLHLACSEGKLETVQFLLDLNQSQQRDQEKNEEQVADRASYQIIDPNAIDRFGTSPMENAVEAGHREVVIALKSAGGRLILSCADLAQRLCAIVMAGDATKLDLYISCAGVRCGSDVCDYDKRTPLHIAAVEGNMECARILLKGGADPSAEDRWGQTPKTEAERAGHVGMKALLE
jgi:hypothetical protein